MMLGFGASIVPQCGYDGFSTALPFVIGAGFKNAGVDVDKEKLIESLPNGNTIQKLVADNAINT
eukprot:5810624-Ditylum_brightwellii.AAC.1